MSMSRMHSYGTVPVETGDTLIISVNTAMVYGRRCLSVYDGLFIPAWQLYMFTNLILTGFACGGINFHHFTTWQDGLNQDGHR